MHMEQNIRQAQNSMGRKHHWPMCLVFRVARLLQQILLNKCSMLNLAILVTARFWMLYLNIARIRSSII